MSLFSFANISFGSKDRKVGVNTGLGLKNDYAMNLYRYPIDLGSSDKGHYMVFHINKQQRSKLSGSEVKDNPTVIQNRLDYGTKSPATYLMTELTGNANKGIAFTRTIKRISDTVALYMPDTVTFQHNQGYTDAGLSGLIAAAGSVLAQKQSIIDHIGSLSGPNKMKAILALAGNLSPMLATMIKDNPALSAGFTAYTGVVINPMLEMIYSTPSFREFRYDFMFYPRSEKEATEVQKIINRLYFHQAPEIESEGEGFFLIPPSEFDIKFYYNGKENPNIPKISTCVLTSIDVDYAPNGFAAYENQKEMDPELGRTGMPVAIRLSLNFKETEIMTKDNFNQINTALKYGTNVGSEQTKMLTEQNKGFFS
jgi:hypothetical protein